ncbi:hypothetical protein D3C79_738470 [compost metagenome]
MHSLEDLLVQLVKLAVGPQHIDAGQHERGDDEAYANRDAAGDAGAFAERSAKPARGKGDEQDERQVEPQHQNGEGPGEALAFADQLLEVGILLDPQIALLFHCSSP